MPYITFAQTHTRIQLIHFDFFKSNLAFQACLRVQAKYSANPCTCRLMARNIFHRTTTGRPNTVFDVSCVSKNLTRSSKISNMPNTVGRIPKINWPIKYWWRRTRRLRRIAAIPKDVEIPLSSQKYSQSHARGSRSTWRNGGGRTFRRTQKLVDRRNIISRRRMTFRMIAYFRRRLFVTLQRQKYTSTKLNTFSIILKINRKLQL